MSKRKQNRRKVFANVPQDKEFWSANGSVIKNLYGLSGALETMDDYTFSQHVTDDKNDFSNWVNHVVGDEQLSQNLSDSKDKNEHTIAVLKHVVQLLK